VFDLIERVASFLKDDRPSSLCVGFENLAATPREASPGQIGIARFHLRTPSASRTLGDREESSAEVTSPGEDGDVTVLWQTKFPVFLDLIRVVPDDLVNLGQNGFVFVFVLNRLYLRVLVRCVRGE